MLKSYSNTNCIQLRHIVHVYEMCYQLALKVCMSAESLVQTLLEKSVPTLSLEGHKRSLEIAKRENEVVIRSKT